MQLNWWLCLHVLFKKKQYKWMQFLIPGRVPFNVHSKRHNGAQFIFCNPYGRLLLWRYFYEKSSIFLPMLCNMCFETYLYVQREPLKLRLSLIIFSVDETGKAVVEHQWCDWASFWSTETISIPGSTDSSLIYRFKQGRLSAVLLWHNIY